MRPLRLEVRGFTAFREPAVVDFEGRRLFVVTGPTGAGKSSLLDAMTWALFGQVPRVGRSVRELLAQGEREMSVMLDFTVRGQPYRVARRHPGTTSTRLERIVDGQPLPIADRATDVTREVERILGMDYATFTRAILLPQGQFDSFLRGEAKDRRAILGQLIGLGVYERAGAIARARAARHRTEADAIAKQLEHLAFATPELLTSLREEEARLAHRQAEVQERRAALQALGETARMERDRRQARDAAAAEASEATRGAADATTARQRTAEGVAASRSLVEQRTFGRNALAYDRAEHERLRDAVARLDQRAVAEADLASSRHEIEVAATAEQEATATAEAAAGAARDAERDLATTTRAHGQAAEALARAAGRAARTRSRIEIEAASIEREVETVEAEARALEQRARDLDALRQSLTAADGDLERAASAAARAEAERAASTTALVTAQEARSGAERDAELAREALERARREDAAAHLRSGLQVGDRCPVCGEPITILAEHAAPDLQDAEAALAAAERALAQARTTAEQASAALAAAEARMTETANAHTAIQGQHTSIVARIEEQQASPEHIEEAIAAARQDATRHSELATQRRAAGRALAEDDQALRDLVARLPQSIEPVEAKRAPSDVSVTLGELGDALAAHADAEGVLHEATRTHERATSTAEAAAGKLEVARRDVVRAHESEAAAARRLAALGEVTGDPESLRTALATADAQAQRVEVLEAAIQSAREALIASEAAHQGAEQATAQAEEQRTRRAAALAQAESELAETWAAYAEQWHTVIGDSTPDFKTLRAVMEDHEAERVRLASEVERVRGEVERAADQIEQAERMRREVEEHRGSADLVGSVGTDLQGNRFIAYLLHESMQLLASDASHRLGQFTNGRYALRADGDEFQVVDHLNGDEERSVKTLSGGETFLASLALALSLSEHLPEISGTGGAVSLDSLFLDEGFGALDAESLDLAVQGLETLAEGTRMVGVITHVEELAERLPDRIRVEKGAHGSTVVA